MPGRFLLRPGWLNWFGCKAWLGIRRGADHFAHVSANQNSTQDYNDHDQAFRAFLSVRCHVATLAMFWVCREEFQTAALAG